MTQKKISCTSSNGPPRNYCGSLKTNLKTCAKGIKLRVYRRLEPLYAFNSISSYFSFCVQSCCSFFVWCLEPLFLLVQYSELPLQFDVQSHIFFVWSLEPSFTSFRRSEAHLHFGIQSRIFRLVFWAAFSSWRLEPHLLLVWLSELRSHFYLQSHHVFSHTTYKVIFLILTFLVINLVFAFKAAVLV